MIGKRIIVAAVIIVNAAIGQTTFAAIKANKKDVAQLITWLQQTGKERDDYNAENAVLIGLMPGQAKSKARGAPGKEGEPYRYIYLFSKGSKAQFLIIKKGNADASSHQSTTYKVRPNGKVDLAFTLYSRKADGNVVGDSVKQTDHKLDKETLGKVNDEIAFWLPRAQKDLPPPPAPAAKN